MSARYSGEEWALWLEEYRQSDVSLKEFCDLIEVSAATFYNWQRKPTERAQRAAVPATTACSLAEANFSEAFLPTFGGTVAIQLPGGASADLPNNVDYFAARFTGSR